MPELLVAGDGSYSVVEYDVLGAQATVGRIVQRGGLFLAYRHHAQGEDSLLGTFQSLEQAQAAAVSAEPPPPGVSPQPPPASRWYLPLLWILLIPIVTVPLTNVLGDRAEYHSGFCSVNAGNYLLPGLGVYASCSTGLLLLLLSPGLLNLVPLWWLRSTHPKLRAAALWATVLGALRLIVPATAVIASPVDNPVDAVSGLFGPSDFVLSILTVSLVLWLATIPAIWIVGRLYR